MKRKAGKSKQSLMSCVKAGDVDGLRKLVASGVGLMDEMEDTSPLSLAIENGNTQMVKVLLELGHDPDIGGCVVPLALAARSGNKGIVELLLKNGADVNAQGEEGETALMWAAGAGELQILKRLVEAGGKIKQQGKEGGDALDYALRSDNQKVVEFLLPQFPRVRQEKVERQSHLRAAPKPRTSKLLERLQEARNRPTKKTDQPKPLFAAFCDGQHDQFMELLTAGADPNETRSDGTTILAAAATSRSGLHLVEPLLKAGADPNRGELFRPLKSAAGQGPEYVRMLLKAGADANWADADGQTALMSAAAGGDEESVRLLLEAGADPNAEDNEGHSAYWCALEYRAEEVQKLLAPLSRDPEDAKRPWRKNKQGQSLELCFLDAVVGGDIEYVQKLLAEGVRVDVADESGDTALHHAAQAGNLELMDSLISAKAPIDAQGCGDHTPLVAAANSGQTEAVKWLLETGADVHADEDAILCYACEHKGSLPMVEVLLAAGAEVNVRGGHRMTTPLHVATEHDDLAVVRRLLQAGAKIGIKDGNGWTPFLNAALRSGVEVVRTLIEAGSDVKAVDEEGRDAYELARMWGKKQTAEFLQPIVRGT